MGRNEGGQMKWIHAHDGSEHLFLYYCQQHNVWHRLNNASLSSAFQGLKAHINDIHGAVEQ